LLNPTGKGAIENPFACGTPDVVKAQIIQNINGYACQYNSSTDACMKQFYMS